MKKTLFITSILILMFSAFSCKSAPATTDESNKAPSEDQKEQEYQRSIGTLEAEEEITYDTFEADKKAIFKTISLLDTIIKDNDYNKWLLFITPQSKAYWSNTRNLDKASKKLPIKIPLPNLEAYFKYVFCPSRANSQIDEIRYISSTQVSAVHVEQEKNIIKDIIIYSLVKQNDRWLVELDRIN
ncbi:MAG: hypothetical protein K6G52_01230 [Treponemataceae bacterium]|nr:hypothetical protein [Treponemataceae bacterium]